MKKKHDQLGMNAGTAAGKLRTDLLFDFVIRSGHKCFRCGGILTRDDFSVEHKIPWLDSDNPRELFFNISNIAYSHQSCNSGARRRKPCVHGISNRCDKCRLLTRKQYRENHRELDTSEYRRQRGWRN